MDICVNLLKRRGLLFFFLRVNRYYDMCEFSFYYFRKVDLSGERFFFVVYIIFWVFLFFFIVDLI